MPKQTVRSSRIQHHASYLESDQATAGRSPRSEAAESPRRRPTSRRWFVAWQPEPQNGKKRAAAARVFAIYLNLPHTACSHTQLAHTQLTLTHNLLTHNLLTHNLLTHTTYTHTQLAHTQLAQTHTHTTCSRTTCTHTHNLLTHNLLTHSLLIHNLSSHHVLTHNLSSHNFLWRGRCGNYGIGLALVARLVLGVAPGRRGCWRGRRGAWRHPSSFHMAGVVLSDIDWACTSAASLALLRTL